MCKTPNGFCNKCAGNLWYRLGIRKVGVITPQIPSTLKNLMMSFFHNSQTVMQDINVYEAFLPDEVQHENADLYNDGEALLEEAIPEGIVKR